MKRVQSGKSKKLENPGQRQGTLIIWKIVVILGQKTGNTNNITKSKSSPTEATKACKIYELYIHDILQKVDAVMTIFAMEKEIRNL